MDTRLPAHLEVSGLIRLTQSAGGFGMVLNKGDRDAGTIMVVLIENGANARVYERMPQIDGTRGWVCSKRQETQSSFEFAEYVSRRGQQDPDMWIVELDIAQGERLIGLDVGQG